MKKNMKKKNNPIPVYVAIPNHDSRIHVQLVNRLVQMFLEESDRKKYEITLRFSKITGIDYNRNAIVNDFLKTENKWLLMIDSDNPPINNPLNLIEFNKDVMCLPTMMWRGVDGPDGNEGLAYNVYKKIRGGWKTFVYDGKNKLFQADRVGTGCILIKRRVLEKIKAPFASKTDKKTGMRTLGEDVNFSDKAKRAGFKLYGHWDYSCSHYKEVDLLDVAQLLIKLANKNKRIEDLTPLIKTKR